MTKPAKIRKIKHKARIAVLDNGLQAICPPHGFSGTIFSQASGAAAAIEAAQREVVEHLAT